MSRSEFRMFEVQRAVGYWRIGGVHGLAIAMTQRPRWLTRVLCRWLLEWSWHDDT